MSPKAVLFVDHAQALGGAENSLLLLLKYLDARQWQAHLAADEGPLMENASQLGTTCHQLDMPRLKRQVNALHQWLYIARKLADLAQEIEAVLFYANTVRAALYAALAAKLAKRPFIWHMRDFWLSEAEPNYIWLDTAVKRIICAQATQIIVNSQATAEHLPASGKVSVVHNGLDVDRFDPNLDGRSFRLTHNIPENVPLVGMVGRLRPWKGQKTFLHMAAHIKQTWPHCHFVIVGGDTFGVDDSYPQQLQELRQTLQLTDCVTFTGALSDVRPPLAAMDIFVHPGQPEPFGLVNIEAMAMAKPVVAFSHGALPEIVVAGQTGLLVEPGNGAALAEAVSSLLANPDLGRQLGLNGRQRTETHFTIQHTARKISQILDEVSIN